MWSCQPQSVVLVHASQRSRDSSTVSYIAKCKIVKIVPKKILPQSLKGQRKPTSRSTTERGRLILTKLFINLVAKNWWHGFQSSRSTLVPRNTRKVCCSFQKQDLSQMLTQDCHSDQMKKAEIKVAAFIVEHNLPFHHLSGLISVSFPDSWIVQEFCSKS